MLNVLSHTQKENLRRLGVSLVLLFGSQATDSPHPGSDADVGIVFDPSIPVRPRRYGEVYALLQPLLGDSRLDLVVLDDAAYTLQYKAAMEGKPLFETDVSSFADFRETAMRHYFDFQPLLRIHNQALGIQNV